MQMNLRTKETLHVSELIGKALMPFNVPIGNMIPPADGSIRTVTSHEIEGVGPVRPAERVPQSSSPAAYQHTAAGHTLHHQPASKHASVCPGKDGEHTTVAAA